MSVCEVFCVVFGDMVCEDIWKVLRKKKCDICFGGGSPLRTRSNQSILYEFCQEKYSFTFYKAFRQLLLSLICGHVVLRAEY